MVPLERARTLPDGRTAWLDGERDPLHLYGHRLAPGQVLSLRADPVDRVCHVWRGAVSVGNTQLPAGSTAIVEHGASLSPTAGDEGATILVFQAATQAQQSRAGGQVHLLPESRVPRTPPTFGGSGASGGMHADSACPTCEVWLHENHFPARPQPSREEEARGVHAHTEDEIIFVTSGQIRLGNRLHGPGTALAVAANTLYTFTAGPEGLSFVNFRAQCPSDIRFADGGTMSETGYWEERVARPGYLVP